MEDLIETRGMEDLEGVVVPMAMEEELVVVVGIPGEHREIMSETRVEVGVDRLTARLRINSLFMQTTVVMALSQWSEFPNLLYKFRSNMQHVPKSKSIYYYIHDKITAI